MKHASGEVLGPKSGDEAAVDAGDVHLPQIRCNLDVCFQVPVVILHAWQPRLVTKWYYMYLNVTHQLQRVKFILWHPLSRSHFSCLLSGGSTSSFALLIILILWRQRNTTHHPCTKNQFLLQSLSPVLTINVGSALHHGFRKQRVCYCGSCQELICKTCCANHQWIPISAKKRSCSRNNSPPIHSERINFNILQQILRCKGFCMSLHASATSNMT